VVDITFSCAIRAKRIPTLFYPHSAASWYSKPTVTFVAKTNFTDAVRADKDDRRADQIPASTMAPSGSCSMRATCDEVLTMGDLINLKRFKKRSEREQATKEAEVNRARFGRTKAERTLEQRRADRANELLDQHRTDSKDAS
jgi:uncharacterized protein DUF4169